MADNADGISPGRQFNLSTGYFFPHDYPQIPVEEIGKPAKATVSQDVSTRFILVNIMGLTMDSADRPVDVSTKIAYLRCAIAFHGLVRPGRESDEKDTMRIPLWMETCMKEGFDQQDPSWLPQIRDTLGDAKWMKPIHVSHIHLLCCIAWVKNRLSLSGVLTSIEDVITNCKKVWAGLGIDKDSDILRFFSWKDILLNVTYVIPSCSLNKYWMLCEKHSLGAKHLHPNFGSDFHNLRTSLDAIAASHPSVISKLEPECAILQRIIDDLSSPEKIHTVLPFYGENKESISTLAGHVLSYRTHVGKVPPPNWPPDIENLAMAAPMPHTYWIFLLEGQMWKDGNNQV